MMKEILPYIFAILAGIFTTLESTINAKLGKIVSPKIATMHDLITGAIASLVVDRSINASDSIIATAAWCVLPIIVGYNLFFRKIVDSEPLIIIINGTILKVYYIYVSKKLNVLINL